MNNEIVLATNVGQLNVSDLQSKVIDLVRWAHNRAGSKKDADFETIIKFDTNEICRDLQTIPEFKGLKLQDLSKIFQKGLTGGYGDFFGLNCVTYAKWIRAHLSEEKTKGVSLEHERVKMRISEQKEPTEAEKRELSEANLKRVVEKYKLTGIVDDNGNPAYMYLWNTKQINFGADKWQEYLQRAMQLEQSRLNKELKNAKDSLNKTLASELTSALNQLNESQVKCVARNLAVEDWIKKELNK
jgi:hypothetical protein